MLDSLTLIPYLDTYLLECWRVSGTPPISPRSRYRKQRSEKSKGKEIEKRSWEF